MTIHTLRRGLVFLLVDLVIIIGIFVLQFRTDSTIIEKINGLQVTLEREENSENSQTLEKLQNKFAISYNGLNLLSDEQRPAKIIYEDSTNPKKLVLRSWQLREDQGLTLFFEDDIELKFDVSGSADNQSFSLTTDYPSNVEQILIPYTFSYNMQVQKDEGNKVILNSKKEKWAFSTNKVQDDYICFTSKDNFVTYSVYDDTKKFTFDAITELAFADEAILQKSVDAVKNNLISAFKNVLQEESFTENSAIAYVAAMAEKDRYQQAIEEFPSSYKRSSQRTYISSPYFNNLSKMNTTLEDTISSAKQDITNAINSLDINILTKKDIAAYLIIYDNPESVKTLLSAVASTDISLCTLEQVCAFVKTYVELAQYGSELASELLPIMEKCIERFADSCDFDGQILTLKENEQFLSVNQSVDIGMAILRYGKQTNQTVYEKAGRVIVNSYLSEGLAFDIRTLTTLYPMVAYNNTYYPHYEFLQTDSDLIWAYTCAKDIKLATNTEGEITLAIDFPESLIHHVIFKGIPTFSTIYIYDIAYRTDPRFETYNSSGYVYKDSQGTLLLKSRHKNDTEEVRMIKK